jgi:2-keto-4-pentenoate hydratase/2-oxohepta-3-ene-1,7-dioic acid hydratase in catechol pathway
MKLVTFSAGRGNEVGVVKDGRVLSITRTAPQLVRDMQDLIARWTEVKAELAKLESSSGDWLAVDSVTLRAPVPRPGKMLAIGLNYADHIAETGRETPKEQMWFMKASSSASGPYDPIQIPKVSPESVDYEVELIAVIGKGGRHITREQAPAAIFGYCVGNDVSVREWQRHSPQWSVAKSFDSHSPFGPWITTSDELGDPHGLGIRCSVDGEQRQSSNTSSLVFDVWAQVEYLSKAMTLEPGDILFTGTPGGVGWARKPPGFLHPGSVCRCEIDKLGFIEGHCVKE